MVEACCDPSWSEAVGVLLEDTPHDGGLFLVDLAFTCRDGAVVEQLADDPVAIAVAARNPAGLDPTALTAPGLVREVLQE